MGKINNVPNHQPVIHKLLQFPAAQDIHGDARFGHLALHWQEPGGLTCWDAEDADAGYSPIGKSSMAQPYRCSQCALSFQFDQFHEYVTQKLLGGAMKLSLPNLSPL